MKITQRCRNTKKPIPLGSLRTIPGWKLVSRVEIPDAALKGRSGDPRYSASTSPQAMLRAILMTLWCGFGGMERRQLCRGQCSGQTFKRILIKWVPDFADANCILRQTWKSYLGLLTNEHRKQWREMLEAQAETWMDWEQADLFAVQVFSPWFQAVLEETRHYRPRRHR